MDRKFRVFVLAILVLVFTAYAFAQEAISSDYAAKFIGFSD